MNAQTKIEAADERPADRFDRLAAEYRAASEDVSRVYEHPGGAAGCDVAHRDRIGSMESDRRETAALAVLRTAPCDMRQALIVATEASNQALCLIDAFEDTPASRGMLDIAVSVTIALENISAALACYVGDYDPAELGEKLHRYAELNVQRSNMRMAMFCRDVA